VPNQKETPTPNDIRLRRLAGYIRKDGGDRLAEVLEDAVRELQTLAAWQDKAAEYLAEARFKFPDDEEGHGREAEVDGLIESAREAWKKRRKP